MSASAVAAIPATQSPAAEVVTSAGRVRAYLNEARSRNTIRGYRSSFRQFEAWCSATGHASLPASPETVAVYVAAQAGRLKAATIGHHLAAINKAHKSAGLPSPVKDNQLIAETLKGVKRVHGVAPKQKTPIMTQDLVLMLHYVPDNLLGTRDRALLLIGFAGAFRRSELVSLDASDLKSTPEGIAVTLRHSKTDQEGDGRIVAVPRGSRSDTCPVAAVEAWLASSGIAQGPVSRPINRHGQMSPARLTDKAVARIVKRYAKVAGLSVESLSGHSLRAGHVTQAFESGVPESRIAKQTGHKSVEMVLRYVRVQHAFKDNSAKSLGL